MTSSVSLQDIKPENLKEVTIVEVIEEEELNEVKIILQHSAERNSSGNVQDKTTEEVEMTVIDCEAGNGSVNTNDEPKKSDKSSNSSKGNIGISPDGGFGWFIVLASFFASMIGDGVSYSYGVMTNQYIEEYNISNAMVGFMGSLLISITLGSGPLVSLICNKLGFRLTGIIGAIIAGISFALPYFYSPLWFLILTSCVCCGFGLGMVYLPSIVIIEAWFDSKRSFAMGLAVCGSGMGAFVFSPFLEMLLGMFGWKMTMLITGGIILLMAPICAFYVLPKRNPIECKDNIEVIVPATKELTPSTNPEVKTTLAVIKSLLTCKLFLLFALSNLITSIGFNAPGLFIKERGLSLNFTEVDSSYLISTIGIGTCAGRILFGVLGSTILCNRFHMYAWCLVSAGLTLVFSFLFTQYAGSITYTIAYGMFSGAYVTLTPIVIGDMFNSCGSISLVFGLINIFQAIGILIGPSIIGAIVDSTKSFDLAFGITGLIIIISGLMLYIAYASRQFRALKFTATKTDRGEPTSRWGRIFSKIF